VAVARAQLSRTRVSAGPIAAGLRPAKQPYGRRRSDFVGTLAAAAAEAEAVAEAGAEAVAASGSAAAAAAAVAVDAMRRSVSSEKFACAIRVVGRVAAATSEAQKTAATAATTEEVEARDDQPRRPSEHC
jgi:hypothetical protein